MESATNNKQHLVEPMIFCDPVEQYISKRITKMQLSAIRKINHLTQKEMANLTGLSVQCISDIENEENGNPTLKSIVKYLDCLGYEMCFQKKTI